jgi:hypothetical protein
MSKKYKLGSWCAICDVCGFEYFSDELKDRWDGLKVCHKDWEPRHPQDFVRAIPDMKSVPWTRPETSGPDVGPTYINEPDPVPPGTFNNGI